MTVNGGAAPAGAALPDLVYLVRPGENEELRFSLRSIEAHAAGMFRRVWFVGNGLPEWLDGLRIEGEWPSRKFDAWRVKLTAVCADRRVAKRIVVMNDDLFATGPVTEWPVRHLGPVAEYVATLAARGTTSRRNSWVRAVEQTAEWVRAQTGGDVLCYENHLPLSFDKAQLRAVLAGFPADRLLAYAGLYPLAGNAGVGEVGPNVKVKTDAELPVKVEATAAAGLPWLSTNEVSFGEGAVGEHIRAMFPNPSRWEV